MHPLRRLLIRYWPALAAAAVLVPHARLFDFVNDDAYISFRYARNLAQHGELAFNLGERVEGFTNFLWTVLLAAFMKGGVSPVLSSRFFGVAFAVGTLAVVVRMSLRIDSERPRPAHLVAPAVLAATGAFACWATGGLETHLFTFLLALATDRFLDESERRRGFISAGWFALAAMTRPEGVLFFALAGLHRVIINSARERRILPRRHELAWLGVFVGVFGAYFAWRWWYFGWPFPNTFYVKSSDSAGKLTRGLYYLRRFVEDYDFAAVLPVAAAALLVRPRGAAVADGDRRRRSLLLFAVLTALGFGGYVAKVGGDFMGLYRFLVPALPVLAVCAQESARRLSRGLCAVVGRVPVALAGAAVAAGFVAGSVRVSLHAARWQGADNGIDSPGFLKKYADDRVPVGRWFAQHARPDDLMTVGGAGVIPYHAGIRAYDVYGLVDEHIAHNPAMTVSARPGHEKWAGDDYMLSREPTLITHHYALQQRHVPSPDEIALWAARGYEWVTATIPGLDPPYYSFLKRLDRAFGPFPARTQSPPK